MKFLLVGINAKYIHTALGVRSIKAYLQKHSGYCPDVVEYTINQKEDDILKSLYFSDADVYLFSCYIWNIHIIKSIANQLNKIKPNALIFIGGPEATYKAKPLMLELPFLTGVILGEGETTVLDLINAINSNKNLKSVAGLLLSTGETRSRDPLNIDSLAFCYDDIDLLHDQILYYESMRGCPFSCSYCLSSVERGVRIRSTALVFEDLKKFLSAKIRQLKFVDRTFNCNLTYANSIWQFLIDNDNGVTNFHFELAGDILDNESIQLLAHAREGLFQFEIGVQSANPKTLNAIQRVTNLETLSKNIKSLQQPNNIHLHLDLIAGLPYEDLSSFIDSFHWVYSLQPQQFQLGFLKVLGGSQMEINAKEYGLLYGDNPPFQVLSTNWLSYDELTLLSDVEQMIEIYYNSGRFTNTISYLISSFASPFDFYLKLSQCYNLAIINGPLSKTSYYEVLGDLAKTHHIPIDDTLTSLCRYDIMLHEKPKKFPLWAQTTPNSRINKSIWNFYQNLQNIATYLPDYLDTDPKRISRVTHLEIFSVNPETKENYPTAILFNYKARDILGRAKKQFLTL